MFGLSSAQSVQFDSEQVAEQFLVVQELHRSEADAVLRVIERRERQFERLFHVLDEPGDMAGAAGDENALPVDLGGELGRGLVHDIVDDIDDIVDEREHGFAHIRRRDMHRPRRAVLSAAADRITALVVEVEGKRGLLEFLDRILAYLDAVGGVRRVDYRRVERVARDIDGRAAGDSAVGDGGDLGLVPTHIHEQPAYAARVRDETERRFDESDLFDAGFEKTFLDHPAVPARHRTAYRDDGADAGRDGARGQDALQKQPQHLHEHVFVRYRPFLDGLDDAYAAERGGDYALRPVAHILDLVAALYLARDGDGGFPEHQPDILSANGDEFAAEIDSQLYACHNSPLSGSPAARFILRGKRGAPPRASPWAARLCSCNCLCTPSRPRLPEWRSRPLCHRVERFERKRKSPRD